jgi:hypothetical protein
MLKFSFCKKDFVIITKDSQIDGLESLKRHVKVSQMKLIEPNLIIVL